MLCWLLDAKLGRPICFEYFLLISSHLLISTATEHLYKSGIQDRQNKVWESDSNMLTLLTLSTTFVGPTLEKSYQAASHFCSGMALMLGPNFVGFDLKARRLYPTNMGFNPLDSIPRGIYDHYPSLSPWNMRHLQGDIPLPRIIGSSQPEYLDLYIARRGSEISPMRLVRLMKAKNR